MLESAPKHGFTSLEQLFPGLSAEEYRRLDAWYTRYAALIAQVYERISGDPEAYASFRALTDPLAGPTMCPKADSQSIKTPAIKE